MDYTKIPRPLIYKELKDINDFGIKDNSRFERSFYFKLLERPFLLNKVRAEYIENVPQLVLQIFNNAYYICTLIYIEENTEMYITEYLKIAKNYNEKSMLWCNHIMPTTMALVYNLLKRNSYAGNYFLCKIQERFKCWDEDGSIEGKADFFEMVFVTNDSRIDRKDNAVFIDFAPRTITFEAIGEAFSGNDENKTWCHFTENYDRGKISDIFTCLGRTADEKEAMRQSLRYDLEKYCAPARMSHVLAQIDGMDFSSVEHIVESGMEAYCSRLVFENNKMRNELSKLNKQLADKMSLIDLLSAKSDTVELERQIKELTEDNCNKNLIIEGYENQGKGVSAPKNALLLCTLCYHIGGIPANGRQGLVPVLQNLWGYTKTTAESALNHAFKEKDAINLAKIFDSISPKVKSEIEKMPQILKEKEIERLKRMNERKALKK